MTTNDELARLREAFAAPPMSATGAPEPEACPPSDRIWLAVRGELPPDELRGIVDHLAACPSCAEDWRIAMVFEEEARAAMPARPVRARQAGAGTVRYRAWMAIAATLVVAVVGLRLQHTKPHFRSGDGQAVESLLVESLLEENAPLSRQHFVLSWKGGPEAASYDVTVSTIDEQANMTPLDEAKGVTATTYTVPPGRLAGLRSGAKIYWTVIPISRDGGRLQPLTSTVYLTDAPQ